MLRTCGKCGKPLRDSESLRRGFGPECWLALQAPHYSAQGEEAAVRLALERTEIG